MTDLHTKKVCHITSVHKAHDTRIFHKECKTLAASGHEVVLLVPYERDDVINGVRLRHLPKPRNRWDRITRIVWMAYRNARQEKADVYHFHDPELIPLGLLLKFQGKRVIYDIHEDLPRQILIKSWINNLLKKILMQVAELAELIASRIFDGVAAATPVIANRFPESKTVLINNYPVVDELMTSNSLPYSKRPMEITYIGGLSKERGIEEMIMAMALIPETLNARLILAGKCDEPNLKHEVKKHYGWGKVVFLGWQNRKEVAHLLANMRAGLAVLHPSINYLQSQPVKLFEYMAAGLPVIASDFPLWREIIDGSKCGLLVDPSDVQAIAEAIMWLLENPHEAELMGKRGQEAVYRKFNWNTEADKLLACYNQLLF